MTRQTQFVAVVLVGLVVGVAATAYDLSVHPTAAMAADVPTCEWCEGTEHVHTLCDSCNHYRDLWRPVDGPGMAQPQ